MLICVCGGDNWVVVCVVFGNKIYWAVFLLVFILTLLGDYQYFPNKLSPTCPLFIIESLLNHVYFLFGVFVFRGRPLNFLEGVHCRGVVPVAENLSD